LVAAQQWLGCYKTEGALTATSVALCRCLAIGAPDQETKLQLLSEIAQEHEVEWDSHRAHQEMVTG